MNKFFVVTIVTVMTVAASVTAFANVSENECDHYYGVNIEATAQGNGACSAPNCKCSGFNQRPGYYQCWCGHQRFSHK